MQICILRVFCERVKYLDMRLIPPILFKVPSLDPRKLLSGADLHRKRMTLSHPAAPPPPCRRFALHKINQILRHWSGIHGLLRGIFFGTVNAARQTSAKTCSSLEWQMLSLNRLHKHPKPTATRFLAVCLDCYWQLTARLAESSGRWRSLLLRAWQLTLLLHTHWIEFSSDHLQSHATLRPRVALSCRRKRRILTVSSVSRWKISELLPLLGHRLRSLSLDWAVIESDLIKT